MRSLKLPIWALLLAVAAVVALLGWWGNDCLRTTIESELKAQLTATLNANVTALDIWSTNQMRIASSVVEYPGIRAISLRILTNDLPADGDYRSQNQMLLQQFARVVRPRLKTLSYEIADLVNTNYIQVANTLMPQLAGQMVVSDAHTNQFARLFASGEPVIISPFKPDLPAPRRVL